MRTLPHSSECGEFFLYLRPLCPNRRLRRKKTAQVREKTPPLFAKTPLLSRKTCGLSAAPRPPFTPLARRLPLSPPQRQDSPHFSDAKSEKNRPIVCPSRQITASRCRRPCISCATIPFQATVRHTLLCQKTAICDKSPLFCHNVTEKRPATRGFLQTFFIFAI